MGRSGNGATMAVVVAVMWCMVVEANVLTVGERRGWVTGVDYNAWAKSKTFKVGDLLVFDYSSAYSVDEVFESDYNSCNVDHPIFSDDSGSTAFNLITAGPRYFICGDSNLCKQGMKLFVNVTT
ncbi:hypothetical protein HRI_001393600 [Hibiscus trionum]|uniref:Phytocyanin domain-containing protein n=1 Tax=Hibiscus trionum TaxID=183268 RepID=A0A9W7HI10_HIBTR|nr:hypothetical protein HRI_001393600 [Hibiscus trionum]